MTDSLSNAALVLKSLSKSEAAKIMSKLEVVDVRAVMQRSDQVNDRTEQEVLDALGRLSTEARGLSEGCDAVRGIDVEKLPPAPQRRDKNGSNPFRFLTVLPAELQYQLLKDEHPENIGVVTTYLPTEVSAELLKQMTSSLQISVLRRLCHPFQLQEQQVSQLASNLRSRLDLLLKRLTSPTGVQYAANLLSCTESRSQEVVLNYLNQDNPELVDEIQSTMLRFEDLKHFEILDIEVLLKNANTALWAPALKSASRGVREKIMSNMAPRVVEILSAEIADIHEIDHEQAAQAQSQVVTTCIKLAEKGKINLPAKTAKSNAA